MDVVDTMNKPLRGDEEAGFQRQGSAGTPMGQLREASRRFSGGSEESLGPLSLEWKDLTFKIGNHTILTAVTGICEAGRLTGVMGPSGSGKTTLLNILAGRQNTKGGNMSLSGQISTGGAAVDPVNFRSNIAYVMQEDALLSFETPRECLAFSACLRLSGVSEEERAEFVEKLLNTLHLQSCAGTIVGSALVKGISGGEKKRTSVGVELITDPKMLFLDEPLSGLDSYAAYTLIEALKELAIADVPILCTVHQPSSEIFAMFDDVVMLHAGEIAYHGPASDLAEHFNKLGFACPANFNPADHVMFLLQKEDPQRIREVKDSWKQSGFFMDIVKKVDGLQRSATAARPGSSSTAGKTGFWRQLSMLTAREVRGTLRNKGILFARLGMTVFLSALYGWLFAGSASLGDKANQAEPNCVVGNFSYGACSADFQAHFGTLVSLSISTMMGAAQPVLLQFPQERPVFLREYAAQQYGVVPYFISKTLVEMPVVLMSQVVTFLISYWLMGLHGNWLYLVLISWALGLASSSISLLVGCGVASAQKAIQLAPLALIPQMLFSGLFLPVSKIPPSLRWVRFLCPLKYAINVMTIAEFEYVHQSVQDCLASHSTHDCEMMIPGDFLRDQLVQNQSIDWDGWGSYLAALLGLLVAFRVLATILLWRKGKYVF
mmetsp:Transcript_105347/g.187284  ORF Transcript_105347/g.187284 Transcript_105347/m.187284 type:complete len:662 (-) Transcript_105347:55-2040(-)